MENVTHGLYLAFAMFAFIVGVTFAIYMINSLNSTVETVVYSIDETNYYDTVTLNELIEDSDGNSYKVVTVDSIIPTLYRYYKESFCVKILDEDGDLLQMFDTTVEEEVNTAYNTASLIRSDKQKALLELYDDETKVCYMYTAPWISGTDSSKERIDMYIYGGSGYINNVWVDYSISYSGYSLGNNLKESNKIYLNNFENRKFKEIFSEYSYEGDTIEVEGDEYETLTGTKQTSTKIVITYQLL